MVVTMVSHICLLVELGPICNSTAASLCLKSCVDHSLLKSYNGGLWKNIYRSGPSTWFVYLYKQTVSITVVVMGTKQFNDKTTHRQQAKTGFVQKWENRSTGLSRTIPGLFSFFKDSISSQFCITQGFKVHFFSVRSSEMNRCTRFL